MKIGDKIEEFSLPGVDKDGNERAISLDDFKGQNVVLYFYPKDETPGCTVEACDFRDNYNRLTSRAVVMGVSPDDVKSHKKFQEKHSLNFILLSDPNHLLSEKFGTWGKMSVFTNRSTFLIDKESILRKIWKDVNVKGHVDEVIEEIEKLS